MNAWPDDLRLIVTIAVNALMLTAAWRLAGRNSSRAVVVLPDALLLWLAGQYVVTGLCGLLGVLHAEVFLGAAAVLSIASLCLKRRAGVQTPPIVSENRIVYAALAFVIAYAGALFFHQRSIPQLATDPLVYPLPAAAQWLQAGRISFVDFWYWLPANTYSPLAGSVWIAWWLGPIGNDSLARFVQLPMWLLLFAGALRLLRDLRVPAAIATITAISVVVSRPFFTQLPITKDDVAVAALAIGLLGAMHPRRLRERATPVRIGLLLGLLLATKYTSVLALPLLLPAIVLMRRQSAARTLIAGAIAATLVAPWLIRNVLLTGNPIYPLFTGNPTPIADPAMRSIGGLYHLLAGSYHALPVAMWAVSIVCACALIACRRTRRNPIALSLILGPLLVVAAVIVGSPFAEVRFAFPALAAILSVSGIAFARISDRRIGVTLAGLMLALSISTSANPETRPAVIAFAIAGMVSAALIVIVTLALRSATSQTHGMLAAVVATCIAISIYIEWKAYLRHPEVGYAHNTDATWKYHKGAIGKAWTSLRATAPAGATIAYVNTPTIWPLFGFDLQYRVVYAPVRPGIAHLHDLPPSTQRVPAADVYRDAARQLNEGADAATWLANLDRLRADYVFVARDDASTDPPELAFIAAKPQRFDLLSDSAAAVLLRVKR